MKYFAVFLFFISTLTLASDEYCKNLYPQLNQDECHELRTIQENYGKYDSKMKEIAKLRAQEITYNLLNNDEKVEIMFRNIENSSIHDLPLKIINDVIGRWKHYLQLPSSNKKELIRYSLGMKENSKHSEEMNKYLDNSPIFITPYHKKITKN